MYGLDGPWPQEVAAGAAELEVGGTAAGAADGRHRGQGTAERAGERRAEDEGGGHLLSLVVLSGALAPRRSHRWTVARPAAPGRSDAPGVGPLSAGS